MSPDVAHQTVAQKDGNRHQPLAALDLAVEQAESALLAHQHEQGYWRFDLEADCTITAEYILMMHYMDEIDERLQEQLANYIRLHQRDDGGWPLYHGGDADLSCSVKAYFALKLVGDQAGMEHMSKARKSILDMGGAARSNVFTRIMLAQFEQIPWRGVPFMPVEIMLLPHWFPFHISKVSYWSRTVMIPLFILYSLKGTAKNPRAVGVPELFDTPPNEEKTYFPPRSGLNWLFLAFERMALLTEPLFPGFLRRYALKKAEKWLLARLNGEGGLGAIFPAMVNAYEALACLGYGADHPVRMTARKALQALLAISDTQAYCQPCLSPVWDTALSCLALQEIALATGGERSEQALLRGLDWLQEKQILDAPGDWQNKRPQLKGGGWPFQFKNDAYPDCDDTGAVAWAMRKSGQRRYAASIKCAGEWLCGMQSSNGGFAAYDVDNTYDYLNEIPFADHGALLDPPTSDVSARCVVVLAALGRHEPEYQTHVDACLAYLRHEQEADGSWFGRWGTNYIYGTWSVLTALEDIGVHCNDVAVRKASEWLKSVQRKDGGWGEDHDTYANPCKAGQGRKSTTFQTAWALLGLMAAGEVNSPAVKRGVEFLLHAQQVEGLWLDEGFTAPGFPRVFYLKYHGYDKYFPLWALARYRNLIQKIDT
ncbi:MAG: squalene--hopene cyclase [Mariprofundaceae bacterium]